MKTLTAASVLLLGVGISHAGIIPTGAGFSGNGNASAQGTLAGEINSDSYAFSHNQPADADIGPYSRTQGVTTTWTDSSFPSVRATGESASSITTSGPSGTTWSVSGWASADVSGELFNGSLGKGRATTLATLWFTIDEPTLVRLSGFVIGRDFIHPSWTNFEEQASVELWRGSTLLHAFAGLDAGIPVPFDVTGLLDAGSYRLEATARARTESLPGAQPYHPASAFDATLTIVPTPGAATVLTVALACGPRRRRR